MKKILSLAILVPAVALVVPQSAGAVPPVTKKVTICHRTHSVTNPYVKITVAESAIGNGASKISMSSTKSSIGHLLGAAGAVEAIFTTLSLHHQTVPGTLNTRSIDPACNLNVALETRRATIRAAVSNNVGLGGHNGAVVLRRV